MLVFDLELQMQERWLEVDDARGQPGAEPSGA